MARPRKPEQSPPGLEGLDALVRTIGERLGEALGAALVAGIESGVRKAGGLSGAVEAATGGQRATVSQAGVQGCRVPGCVRTAVAKGLCATHYRKARRLKMGPTFDAADLRAIAEDGRKTRFAGGD